MIKLSLRLLLVVIAASSAGAVSANYVGVSNDIMTASEQDFRSEKGPQMFASLQAICASALSKEACDSVSKAHMCVWRYWRKVHNPKLGYFDLSRFKWHQGGVDYVNEPHCQIDLDPRSKVDGTLVKSALSVAGLFVGFGFGMHAIADLGLPISRVKSALVVAITWGITIPFLYLPTLREGGLLMGLKNKAIEAWTIQSSAKQEPKP